MERRRFLGLGLREGIAVILGAFLAAYCIVAADILRLLPPNDALARMDLGTTVGWPPRAFAPRVVGWMIPSLALTFFAARGTRESVGTFALTGVRRVAIASLPWMLTVFVPLHDEVLRRPALIALLLSAGAGLCAAMYTSPDAQETTPSRVREYAPIVAVIVTHLAVMGFYVLRRDRALWSATVDLGIFEEAMWHTLHGRTMYSPTVGYSFLGEHFSPVLFLLVPFYAIWPGSTVLLLAQTFAISLAAWPVYRLGRVNKLPVWLSTLVAASMVFAAPMQSAMMYDFHMDLLGVPCLAWAVLAAHERRWITLSVAAALLCSVKEDAFVPLVCLGASIALTEKGRDRWRGVALAVASVVYCALAIRFFMRAYGPPKGVPVYMGGDEGGYKFLRNYGHFGKPVAWFMKPLRMILWPLSHERLSTLLTLLAPTALLSLFAGRRVLLLGPLSLVLLSDNWEIVTLRYHYPAIQHPGVFCAAVYGIALVASRVHETSRAVAFRASGAAIVAGSLVMVMMHPTSTWAPNNPHDPHGVDAHVAAFDRMVARIPKDANVTASSFGGPRLSNRPLIAMFPNHLEESEWVLVDLQRPAWPSDVPGRDGTLRSLMRSSEWGVADFEDGIVLLGRGLDRSRNRDAVRELFLHRKWEVEGTEQTDFPSAVERDANASAGRARIVHATDRRPPGFVAFGPYATLAPGTFRVHFRLRVASEGFVGDIGSVDVFSQGKVIAGRRLTPEDFPDANWQDVTLDFQPGYESQLEFRVRTEKGYTLGADEIHVEPISDENVMLRNWGF